MKTPAISPSESAARSPYERPSPLRRLAMPVLHVLRTVLPDWAYEAIYSPSFRIYKWLLRMAYHRRIAEARRRGDFDAALRMERVHAVMKHSLVGALGLEHTHDLAEGLVRRGIRGAFVECGVAEGGCAALIAQVATAEGLNRPCWFFDSFEGLPEPTAADFLAGRTGAHTRPLVKGSCLGTWEQVSELLFETWAFDRRHIELVKGWFQDTLPETKRRIGTIALLRIDGDWYESTKCCLEELCPLVVPGGQVIIDDYQSCYGARKATDEYLASRGIAVALIPDGRGGVSFSLPQVVSSQAA